MDAALDPRRALPDALSPSSIGLAGAEVSGPGDDDDEDESGGGGGGGGNIDPDDDEGYDDEDDDVDEEEEPLQCVPPRRGIPW